MAGLLLDKINKIYSNGFHAVKDFELEIKDKEFIILVGPSGCGKSTTLRMIAGLEEISSGKLYIGDRFVNDILPKDRDIAMVFQNYALYPHMTVYDNMAFGLKLHKKRKSDIDRRVKEASKTLGIDNLLDRKPKQLSGGQKQRVALGRAIVRNPQVFLMDEPLSNLDAKLRVQMRTELIKLHNELNTTFVYVTHDQTEAMTMGSRIVVMKDGVIQQIADPQIIYEKPINMFVAGFIGSPQMNFIKCILREKDGRIYAKYYDFLIDLPDNKYKDIKDNDYINKEVILGIRPENIIIKSDSNSLGTMKAKVDVKEFLGCDTYLHLSLNQKLLIVRIKPDIDIKVNTEVNISFDMKKIHLFDKETSKSIFK